MHYDDIGYTTWGVEVEVANGPEMENLGERIYNKWHVHTDGSIRGPGRHLEFSSVVFDSVDGLDEVEHLCDVLNENRAQSNTS